MVRERRLTFSQYNTQKHFLEGEIKLNSFFFFFFYVNQVTIYTNWYATNVLEFNSVFISKADRSTQN